MKNFLRRFGNLLAVGVSLSVTAAGGTADPPKKLTPDAVVKQWTPKPNKGEATYGQTGGSPKGAPDVAGYTFTLTGLPLEEVWNFYAEKCGLEERYKEKNFLISATTTKKGECVVSGRPVAGQSGKHGETMFLLKTIEYTATVSFHLDPDGKTVQGSIAVVLK